MSKKLIQIALLGLTVGSAELRVVAQGTVYISNLEANSLGTVAVASDAWLAQSFRTGPNSQGYFLNNIQLSFAPATGTPSEFSVFLYGSNGTYPGSSLAGLSGPSNPSDGGIVDFSAPSFELLPSTTYWIVFTAQSSLSSGAYHSSVASFFNYSANDNWSMHRYYTVSANGSLWALSAVGYDLQFAINATAIPEPSSLALVLCGGALWLAGRGRRRNGGTIKCPVPL